MRNVYLGSAEKVRNPALLHLGVKQNHYSLFNNTQEVKFNE